MYIIGDAAYPVKTWLMTGFKDNGYPTAQQKRFTNRLRSNRMVIECGSRLLKGRFWESKVMVDIDRIRFFNTKISYSSMHSPQFLHLLKGWNKWFLQLQDVNDDANSFVNIFADDNNAVRKRAEIMDMICWTFALYLCLHGAKNTF